MAAYPEKRPDGEEVVHLLRTFSRLRSDRSTFDTHWQEVHDRFWPDSQDFLTVRRQGEKRTRDIYDSSGQFGLMKFSAFLEVSLTPRNQPWHRLRATDENLNKDHEVKGWFEEVTRLLHKMRESPRANYYAQMHEVYMSLGAYGNGCLFVDEAPGGIRYRSMPIAQMYVCTDHHGKVDTIYRCYRQTSYASMRAWGARQLPPSIAQALVSENPWQEFEWLHVVRPNKNYDPDAFDSKKMQFESLYVAVQDQALVDRGGYEEMPYLYSRYTVNPSEVYGRGPAMMVLPHVKVANEMTKTFLRAGHRLVDPPLLASSDSVLGSGGRRIQVRPGSITYGGKDSQGRDLVGPLTTGGKLDMTEAMLQRERMAIEQAFYVDIFNRYIENPQMTATQFLGLLREKAQQLAPAAGRQQSETLGPQIEREIGIGMRNGLFPPMPPALVEARGEYEIEYDSPATRYQKSETVEALTRAIEVAMPFVQLDPGVLQVFDAEQTIREVAETLGVNADWMRAPEEYMQLRAQQAQAAATAQMVEMAKNAGSAAKDFSAVEAAMPVPA